MNRECEECQWKMEPGTLRTRDSSGKKVCLACASGRPGGGRATASFEKEARFTLPANADVETVADFLLGHAAVRAPKITALVQELAFQFGGQLETEFLHKRIKGRGRLIEKIQEECDQERVPPAEAGKRFADALRFTVIFPAAIYTEGSRYFVDAIKQRGYPPRDRKSVKNYWLRDDPYDGTNAVFLSDGFPFEVQFHTDASIRFKGDIHGMYEEYRTKGTPTARKKFLWDRMVGLSYGLDRPPRGMEVGVPRLQPFTSAMVEIHYFTFSHPSYDSPTGIFRKVTSANEIVFEYLNLAGHWVEDDRLSRHLVMGSTHVDEIGYDEAIQVIKRLRVPTNEFDVVGSLQRVAHDSGDGVTIYHCPFCGGGQVVGRSDGSTECGFCDTTFTVQVQPTMPQMPQTVDGVPVNPPSIAGDPTSPDAMSGQPSILNGAPAEGEASGEASVLNGAPVGGEAGAAPGDGEPSVLNNKTSSYYITHSGVALGHDAYLRHLAIAHAKDRNSVLRQVRASNRSRSN